MTYEPPDPSSPGAPPPPPPPGQPAPAPGQPPYPPPAWSAPTNTMAILSLVFAFVFAPLAIVFGHMAKRQIRETGEQGDGLATAGLILGYIFTGILVLGCCGGAIAFFSVAASA